MFLGTSKIGIYLSNFSQYWNKTNPKIINL
jgi:hypothetical protein